MLGYKQDILLSHSPLPLDSSRKFSADVPFMVHFQHAPEKTFDMHHTAQRHSGQLQPLANKVYGIVATVNIHHTQACPLQRQNMWTCQTTKKEHKNTRQIRNPPWARFRTIYPRFHEHYILRPSTITLSSKTSANPISQDQTTSPDLPSDPVRSSPVSLRSPRGPDCQARARRAGSPAKPGHGRFRTGGARTEGHGWSDSDSPLLLSGDLFRFVGQRVN